MALLDFAKKKKNQIVDAYKNDASTLGIAKNTVKGLGSAFNQVVSKGPAAAYYDANPKAALNVNRATAFRMPEEIAGNLFSGVKDFAQTAGGAIGEGLAYGIDKNVRDQYKAGNLDILPTVSNVSPLQMIGKTARAGLEVATPKFLSGAASAKAIPEAATRVQRLGEYGKRALRAAPAGYAYDLSNKVAEGGRINDSSTYKPGMGTAMSMVFGAGTKPSIDASKTFAKEVADSPSGQFVSKVNEVLPQIPGAARNSFSNRQPGAIRKERIPSHYIPSRRVPVSEQDGKPGVFPELPKDSRFTGRVRNDGIDPVTLAPRFSVKTERMLPEQIVERGRRKPTLSDLGREVVDALPRPGMNIQAIDDSIKYARPSTVVGTNSGTLKSVVEKRKAIGRKLTSLRKALNDAPIMEKTSIRMELLDTKSKYVELKSLESSLKNRTEILANEQGKTTIKKIDDPLLQEARKYKTTVNLQDKNDLDYLRRIFSEDTINDIKSGKKTNWRGDSYEDLARVNIISEAPKTVEQQLAGKIKEIKLKSDTFYHGTSSGSADSIMSSGFKPGSKLPARAYRGGGYGRMQSTVSLAETPKEAGIFSTLTKDGKIIEAKLKPNARVVSIDGIEDAIDLEDYIGYLRKKKIDAVYIGGGEKELVVINPKAVTPTKSQLTDLYHQATKQAESPLLQEARKYKSAEEFVFNTKTLFRGTNDEGANLLKAGHIPREGLSVTLDPSVAKKYAASRGLAGYTIEKNLIPGAKVIRLEDVPNTVRSSGEGTDFAGKAAIWAKKQGYDVLDMSKGNEGEMRILNKDVLKTKSQLTDLWNKSQGSPKTLKDLGKELVDALPRPGMSIQDVSGGRATPPLPGKIDEIVKAEADAMIDMYRSAEGVKMLNTGYDYLPGSGEFNRVSSNPRWYRDFFKENGRAPSKKEILAMAKDALEKGRGYLQDEFDKAKNPTPDDVNESLLSFGRRQPTKAEVFQQPPRIFKNRTYPQSEPIPGSVVAPSRTLPSGESQLMLPAGPVPTMRPTQAKQFTAKYGQAPEVKTEIKSTRPIYVGESGQASFSRNKAGAADIAENLGDTEFSDIGIVAKGNLDIVRNFRNFFGKRSQEFVDRYITPFQQAKDVMYRNLEKEADNLDKVIVKGLGIERGSKESAAVQEFGEGLRDESSLVKDFGKTKARNIVMANQWFRAQYDRMLGEVNKARSYVYPNQPDKQIQRRDDYYRHFRELQDGFQGLANIFETPAGIDNKLAGISNQTKPNSKWLSFAQKRLGMETDVDAVGGFIDYLGAAEYAKNVDPKIHGFRQLAEQVAEQGNKEGKDYNNFVGFLERTADHLSGKTNSLDRGIQEFTGRKAFRAVDWVNRRVKANTILGNASSSLAQVFAIPAGISSAGEKNFYEGTKRLVRSIGKDDAIMRQSPFLRERYFKALDKFDNGIFNNTKKLAVWMVTALDEMSTKAIWNSHYEKALSEGIQNPIKYSDEMTGNIVGRRGIGETPLLQQSKTFQMIAPFQLEVANAWPLMKELSDSGKAKLVKLLVYTYLLNRGVEAVRGSDVAFDPIQAGIEGYQQSKEEDTVGGKVRAIGGRMAGEVLSNLPLGQTVAGLYPEYGVNDVIGSGVDLPTREKLFGKGDPTRFGSGLLVAKGIQDPLYKLIPPFGGAQIKRTVDGLKSYAQGYKENSNGEVQYPIEKNLRNFIQGGVFGPSSIPEGRSYYKEERTPLGEIQSEKFKLGGGKDYYDKVMNERAADKEKESVKGNGMVDISKASGSSDGIKQLSNGKFYVQSLDKEFDTEKKANRAIALDDFLKSDEETLEYDGKFYTKDDSTDKGYLSKTLESKKKEETSKDAALSKEKMQSYKNDKDVDSWLKEADVLYKKYDKMLRAETDEVERLKIENDMKTLAEQFNKYKSYGGYTKPKKANKVKVPSINDADFIVKKMTSRLRPLRAFGRSRTSLASVARPNIRRPKRLS